MEGSLTQADYTNLRRTALLRQIFQDESCVKKNLGSVLNPIPVGDRGAVLLPYLQAILTLVDMFGCWVVDDIAEARFLNEYEHFHTLKLLYLCSFGTQEGRVGVGTDKVPFWFESWVQAICVWTKEELGRRLLT